MKKLFLFALALCAAASRAAAQSAAAPPEPPKVSVTARQPAPAIKAVPFQVVPDEVFNQELKGVDGGSFFLSNYRGQVFVVNLWATWCGPCRLEIPELNKVYGEYSARGVEFIGLTTEDPATDVERVHDFLREFKVKYKLGWVDAETGKTILAGNNSIPQTIVVAADGRVVTRFRGYSERSPAMLRASIERALSLPPAPAAAPAPAAEPAAPPQAPDAPTRP